jgi:hypothetical protein
MAEYQKEMGPPPIDVDQLAALPPMQRRSAEKKAEAQTKKDYPQSDKMPVKKFAKGGSIDGCAQRGKTKGMVR